MINIYSYPELIHVLHCVERRYILNILNFRCQSSLWRRWKCHYGSMQLEINFPHQLLRDHGNTYDNNAVRVVKYGDRSITPKSVAFLARPHATIFSTIFYCSLNVNGRYLKAKKKVAMIEFLHNCVM